MKSLLESLNYALFESKTVPSQVDDFFSWYFDENCTTLIRKGELADYCSDILNDELNDAIKKVTHKDYDSEGCAELIESNLTQLISVKFDKTSGGYSAQFTIKDKKFGTVNFDLDCMDASLKPYKKSSYA